MSLGSVAGIRGWDPWLGPVAGIRGWDPWLGSVAGIRGWDPWLGSVAGIRGWDPWLGSVAGIRTAACLVVCAVLCVRLVPTPPLNDSTMVVAAGLNGSTMVVMHADHGWHLGEYAMWEKRTNWELAVRVPLIIRVPWLPAGVGQRSRALVELVDLYKTICDVMGASAGVSNRRPRITCSDCSSLTGVRCVHCMRCLGPRPRWISGWIPDLGFPIPDPGRPGIETPSDTVPLDGTSLKPILEAPTAVTAVKPYALSTFPRCTHTGMHACMFGLC